MKHKVIFVHGLNGSSKTDFFLLLAKELEKKQIDFDISDFPGGLFNSFPRADKWIEQLHTIISRSKKPIFLVGYSLGTRAVLLYLEKYKTNVDKVLLISAPPNTTLVANAKLGRVRSFFTHKIDLNQVKKLSKKFILMHSKDDPAVKYEWGEQLAKELGAEFISFETMGHFNNPSNAQTIFSVIKKEL